MASANEETKGKREGNMEERQAGMDGPIHDDFLRLCRAIGKNPNSSNAKKVKEKTCSLLCRREAMRSDANTAAFNDTVPSKWGFWRLR